MSKFSEKMAELEKGLNEIESSKAIKKALDLQGKMLKLGHRYSYRNTMMAMIEAERRGTKISFLGSSKFWFQMSGQHNKTLDQKHLEEGKEGKRKWEYYGIKKGSQGYTCVYPKFKKDKKTKKNEMIGYGYGNMFDISQTGLAMEMMGMAELIPEMLGTDSVASLKGSIVKMITDLGYKVNFKEMKQGHSGYLRVSSKEIYINSLESDDDQISTLFHELAHGELGHGIGGEHGVKGYEAFEVQAESVAYILASTIGLDTSKYSLKYIYSYGKDIKFILECAGKTNKVINSIMEAMVDIVEEIAEERAVA